MAIFLSFRDLLLTQLDILHTPALAVFCSELPPEGASLSSSKGCAIECSQLFRFSPSVTVPDLLPNVKSVFAN